MVENHSGRLGKGNEGTLVHLFSLALANTLGHPLGVCVSVLSLDMVHRSHRHHFSPVNAPSHHTLVSIVLYVVMVDTNEGQYD